MQHMNKNKQNGSPLSPSTNIQSSHVTKLININQRCCSDHFALRSTRVRFAHVLGSLFVTFIIPVTKGPVICRLIHKQPPKSFSPKVVKLQVTIRSRRIWTLQRKRWHDSSSEDEKWPMNNALDALKHFRKGIKSLECAMCQYTVEFKPTDPYDTKRYPFKRQFENTFEGICGIFFTD